MSENDRVITGLTGWSDSIGLLSVMPRKESEGSLVEGNGSFVVGKLQPANEPMVTDRTTERIRAVSYTHLDVYKRHVFIDFIYVIESVPWNG